MIRIISIIFAIVITSFYYFPFVFTFFPVANTKMILAVGGLVLLFYKLASSRRAEVDTNFLIISLFALSVSFASLLSISYNNTPDMAYVTYITSMWVWLSAAYLTVNIIKGIHGKISVELVCCYLIAVGTVQCIIAVAIDNVPIIKGIVDGFLDGWGFMGKVEGRLYGIGCALDVAGGRMAILLVIIAYLLPRALRHQNYKSYVIPLLIAYCIIAVIGNMIGRTTTVGLIVSFLYIIYMLGFKSDAFYNKKRELVNKMFPIVGIGVILVIYLYNTNYYWRDFLRFGFEGFFSLVEKGEWDVHSNNLLAQGFIFPDNLRGWIIGDGYMGNPHADPYYIGESSYGFYKNTDSGYSRFILYFGLIGLTAFSLFFFKVTQICMKKFPAYQWLFLMILALNFGIWVKASTDIFLVLAPFLCISVSEEEEYERNVAMINGGDERLAD